MAFDFWTYFLRTLAYPLIQKAGPLTQLAKGGAGSLDATKTDILWLRNQFFAELADEQWLERFANSRRIVRAPHESDEQFAERVVWAYAWHKAGGTEQGLVDFLARFGLPGASTSNVRDEDPARWAEFRLWLTSPAGGLRQGHYDTAIWAANELKPARSLLAGIRVTVTTTAKPVYGVAISQGKRVTILPSFAVKAADGERFRGIGVRTAKKTHIPVRKPNVAPDTSTMIRGIGIRTARKTTVRMHHG